MSESAGTPQLFDAASMPFYRSDTHRRLLCEISRALKSRQRTMYLIGPRGCGGTTFLQYLTGYHGMDHSATLPVYVDVSGAGASNVEPPQDRDTRLHRQCSRQTIRRVHHACMSAMGQPRDLRSGLSGLSSRNIRLFLLLDHTAPDISEQVMQRFSVARRVSFLSVFTDTAAADSMTTDQAIAGFRWSPLSAAETNALLDLALDTAGIYHGVFSRSARAVLHQQAKGNPGRVAEIAS
ncbi:MAG: hypothetical protein AAFP90_03940, partial [Planctomycetota bacterium]